MMRILVIGRNGQVARALSRHAGMHCIGRPKLDLGAPRSLRFIEDLRPAAIINAAAYTDVDGAESDQETAFAVNALGPKRLAKLARRMEIPFVHISSDYVFDGSGSRPWRPHDPTHPIQTYGASKLAGEQSALAHGGHVLRVSWVISEHPGNFVSTMCRLASQRHEVAVVNDQIGAPTPARAVAMACLRLAQINKPGISHFAGWPNVSRAELARAVFEHAQHGMSVREIPSTAYPTPALRPLNSRLDCSAFTQMTGLERPDWAAELPRLVQRMEVCA